MKRFARALPRLLVCFAVFTVAACGGEDASTSTTTTEAGAGNPTDRGFIAAMVPHHRSAIEMAEVARREGDSEFVTTLADDIVRTQEAEIAELERIDARLSEAGVEEGTLDMGAGAMGMEMDSGSLSGAEPFDEKFLAMMVPHHEGAVRMARVELEEGSDPELKRLARQIITAQERELEAMRQARR